MSWNLGPVTCDLLKRCLRQSLFLCPANAYSYFSSTRSGKNSRRLEGGYPTFTRSAFGDTQRAGHLAVLPAPRGILSLGVQNYEGQMAGTPIKDMFPFGACGAKTRRGTQCRCRMIYANGRCRFHGGLSTGPRTREGKLRSTRNIANWRRSRR
jgi:hypothetical protein